MPRAWNMHHGAPEAGRVVYCGRSRKWGGPSPLANRWCTPGSKYAIEHPDPLGMYRRWIWERMAAGDKVVGAALDSITADDWLGCTCAPRPCHVDVIAKAWETRRAWLSCVETVQAAGWTMPADPLAFEICAVAAGKWGLDAVLTMLREQLDGPCPSYALEPIGAALGERFECPYQLIEVEAA